MRKQADFPPVFSHERVRQTDQGGKADDNGKFRWRSPRRDNGLASHQLATSSPKRPSAPDTYREGNAGRQVGESQSSPTPADPLVLRPRVGRETSDGKSGQTNSRCRWSRVG